MARDNLVYKKRLMGASGGESCPLLFYSRQVFLDKIIKLGHQSCVCR